MNHQQLTIKPTLNSLYPLLVTVAVMTTLLSLMGNGFSIMGVDSLRPLVVSLTWPLILGMTVWAYVRYRGFPWVIRPLIATLPFLFVQVLLDLIFSTATIPPQFKAANLGSILLVQGLVITSAIFSLRRSMDQTQTQGLAYRTRFARLTVGMLALNFIVLVSGISISMTGSGLACPGWPLCDGSLLPHSPLALVQVSHRVVVGATLIGMVYLLVQAWTHLRGHTAILTATTAATVLFAAQALLGGYRVLSGDNSLSATLHSLTGVAIWGVMVILTVQTGLMGQDLAPGEVDRFARINLRSRARDLLILMKPIIVALLLFTTYAGMVVAAGTWPSLRLAFWTMVGGAMAAGGSSAINQYIDRHLDRLMSRTSKRPIAAGRLTPAEGLAFGVALCLMAFYLLAVFVNFIAAVLSVVGMVYYVVVYSIVLKKATVQNIVIGGGAGAIPPLVGWAAVTGGLTLPALLLFVLIFFWTPPHFWALAIVRRKDYQRAGIPMLPVVRGEEETRFQIFLYTIGLVLFTLGIPLFGVGGWIYFVLAVVFGFGLISSAWKVWKKGGNKVAWRMYRHSSMYLAFIFLALMLDSVVL